MTRVSVHTIHLRLSIKYTLGLPNTIYTQNRALILILKKKHIMMAEMSQTSHFSLSMKNAGLLECSVRKKYNDFKDQE